MPKKILITGAAGYIGSILTTKLVELGFDVLAVDKLCYESDSLSHLYFYKNFRFIKGDVTKAEIVKKILKNRDFIIPLAALVGAPLCEKNKKEAYKLNVYSIKLILRFIKNRQKIIYPTTNSGYGIGEKSKFCDENSALRPVSFYGVTKVKAETLVRSHKNYICFRLATVFGISYRMRSDLLVNNFVMLALRRKKLLVFEPNFRRNYIHIRDVAEAFIFSIVNFKKLKNNIYNLGLSSANLTKISLARKIKNIIKNITIKIVSNISDPDKRDYYVSNKKIEKKGFKARINLETGINELVNYFKYSNKKNISNY